MPQAPAAEATWTSRPERWDADELRLRRYRLTDWLDDIRHPRAPEELVATGAYLYQDAADFFFRARGLWSAHSKTIPRRLRKTDEAFAEKFCRAFDALFAEKETAPVIALVEEMLAPFGGLLFEGSHVRAENEPAGVDNLADPLLQLVQQWRVLRLDVNQRDLWHGEPV